MRAAPMKQVIRLAFAAVLFVSNVALATFESEMPDVAVEPKLSAPAAEVVKLLDSSVEENVALAYIRNSTKPFELSAADVIYLKDLGTPSGVITAMLEHDKALRDNPRPEKEAAAPAPSIASPQAEVVSIAPLTETTVQPANLPPEAQRFYDRLAPYGAWVLVDELGWGWQPQVAVVNHTWRPYCDAGHWLWTDRGWYWASDYSWGDIAFHYGRWSLTKTYGWVWFPDTEWAPSWVTWRVHDSYCGWAPLPPRTVVYVNSGFYYRQRLVTSDCDFGLQPGCFTFVPLQHCFDRRPRSYCVPPVQVNFFFHRTVVVNNFSRRRDAIINDGIDVNRITATTGKTIPRVKVIDTPTDKKVSPRIVKNGTTVAVVKAPLPVMPNPAQKNPVLHKNASASPVMPVAKKTPAFAPVSPVTVAENKKSGPDFVKNSRTITPVTAPKPITSPSHRNPTPQPVVTPGVVKPRVSKPIVKMPDKVTKPHNRVISPSVPIVKTVQSPAPVMPAKAQAPLIKPVQSPVPKNDKSRVAAPRFSPTPGFKQQTVTSKAVTTPSPGSTALQRPPVTQPVQRSMPVVVPAPSQIQRPAPVVPKHAHGASPAQMASKNIPSPSATASRSVSEERRAKGR